MLYMNNKFNYLKKFLFIAVFLVIVFTQNCFAVNNDYAIEMTFGEYGNREGQFSYPVCLVLDKDNNIYVTDWENDRIQIFNSDGEFVRVIPDENSDFQIDGPVGIALDDDLNIIIVEQHNHRLHKISHEGQSLQIFGQIGSNPGEFDNPRGIALDKDGNIYVVDTGNNRIQVLSKEFELRYTFGREGLGDGEFYYPRGIALDKNGNIYVADTFHHQVQIFNETGQFIRRLGSPGSGPGEFNGTRYIAIDTNNNIYVTDYKNGKVVQYDSEYQFVTEFGSNEQEMPLNYPEGIAVDQRGYIYVAVAGNNQVAKYCISKIIINKKLGLEYIENAEWEKAIQSFQNVLKEDPVDYESRKAIAFAYYENGQLEKAIDEYTFISEEYPQDQNIKLKLIDAHYRLASEYVKDSYYKEALNHFNIVLANQSNYPEAKKNYYLTYLKYLYHSILFRVIFIIILVTIIILFGLPKIFRKKKKSSKHYRGRS